MTIAGELLELVFSMPIGWVFERQDPRRRRAWITVAKILTLIAYLAAVAVMLVVLYTVFS